MLPEPCRQHPRPKFTNVGNAQPEPIPVVERRHPVTLAPPVNILIQEQQVVQPVLRELIQPEDHQAVPNVPADNIPPPEQAVAVHVPVGNTLKMEIVLM